MENKLLLPMLLQLGGVVVIIAEIILPSGGLLSVLAAGLIGWSLYLVFTGVSVGAGISFVTADIILLPILVIVGLKLLAKSPATLQTELSSKDGVTSQDAEENAYLDARGTAITDLRPAGTALIDNRRVDVVTRGDYIVKGTRIIVVSVTGNQIIVDQEDEGTP